MNTDQFGMPIVEGEHVTKMDPRKFKYSNAMGFIDGDGSFYYVNETHSDAMEHHDMFDSPDVVAVGHDGGANASFPEQIWSDPSAVQHKTLRALLDSLRKNGFGWDTIEVGLGDYWYGDKKMIEVDADQYIKFGPRARRGKALESTDGFGMPLNESEWKDYISGEFWIDDSGQSTFADSNVTDQGHEALAIEGMLGRYFDELWEALDEYNKENPEDQVKVVADREQMDDMIEQYFNNGIPDEVGEKVMGEDQWKLLNKDPRTAYMKYHHMIMCINSDFAVWELDDRLLKAMQDHLGEQSQEGEASEEDEVMVEQLNPPKHNSMPAAYFMSCDRAKQVWEYKVEGLDSFGVPIVEMRTKEIKLDDGTYDAILAAGGTGFRVYMIPNDGDRIVIQQGKKLKVFKEDDAEYNTILKYINLKYQSLDAQEKIKQDFMTLLK